MLGLLWWLSGKESTCNTGDTKDADSIPGLGISPGGGHGNPFQCSFFFFFFFIPVFLHGESLGQSSLAGYSPCDCRESDTTEVTECA